MSSNNISPWYRSAEHILAMKLTLIIVSVLIGIVIAGFSIGAGFEGQQESSFFQDRMHAIERSGNIDNLIEREKRMPIIGNIPDDTMPQPPVSGPRREHIGLRNIVIMNKDGTKTVFGFLANTSFTVPVIQPNSSRILSIAGDNIVFYSFESQGRKLYFYENVDLLNGLRSNVFLGSIISIILFGFILYFIALRIAKNAIEPIRKSEEYARSYNHHIAHELKTPLAIMRSDLELALKSPPDTKEYIGSAIEETNNMRKTIDNLLFLAEREAKKSLEPIFIKKEIEILTEELDKVYTQKKISFDFIGKNEVSPLGDAGLVRALLRNILENIYKYARPKTRAEITLSEKELIFKNISEFPSSKETLNHEFIPFFGTSENGHGLGLSIVKRICDIHGWKISVNNIDAGFEVRIVL